MTKRKIRVLIAKPWLNLLDRFVGSGFVMLACVPVLFLLGFGLWVESESLGISRFVDHEGTVFAQPVLAAIVGLTLLATTWPASRLARRVLSPLFAGTRESLPALRLLLVTFGPFCVVLAVVFSAISLAEGRVITGLAALPVAWLAYHGSKSLAAEWPFRMHSVVREHPLNEKLA